MNNPKILVVGHKGKVGSKTFDLLKQKFPEASGYDIIETNGWAKNEKWDFVIICVPSELVDGEPDATHILQSIHDFKANTYIIRSTIPPKKLWGGADTFVFWPEFYAWTGNGPVGYPEVIGCNSKSTRDRFLEVLVKCYPSHQRYELTDAESAMLAKYASNTFLALKVQFARNVSKVAKEWGADYQDVRNIIGQDSRIGMSHLQTLGQAKTSHCFSKDVPVLLKEFLL